MLDMMYSAPALTRPPLQPPMKVATVGDGVVVVILSTRDVLLVANFADAADVG